MLSGSLVSRKSDGCRNEKTADSQWRWQGETSGLKLDNNVFFYQPRIQNHNKWFRPVLNHQYSASSSNKCRLSSSSVSFSVRPKFLYITVVTCIDCRHSLSLLFALIGEWNGNQWCLKSKKGMRGLPLAFLILPPARKVTWRYVLHSAFTNGDPGVH